MRHVLEELNRRSVWQVIGVYLAGGWLTLEVVSTFQSEGLLPPWAFRVALVFLCVGLLIVVVTAFVQKTGHAGARRPTASTVFSWRNAIIAGISLCAVWGVIVTGWLLFGDRKPVPSPGPVDQPSSNLIAVFPFSVSGSAELSYLREGMVDLLGTALDGAGEIEVVDPFALLSFIRGRENNTTPSPDEGSSLALALGADKYVVGSLIEAGGELRFRAALYDSARRLVDDAEVRVSDEAEVYHAVDDLARQLAGTLLADSPSRIPALAARTTASLPALKAYLEGERAYRSALWDDAIEPLRHAVDLDPDFALAWYRLSVAALWTFRDELARESSQRAMELSQSLSERDQLLLTATHAWISGDGLEAIRQYRHIVAAYPDDLEAWLFLGDVLWHYNPLHGRSAVESREPFERVLAIHSENNEALIHLRHTAAFLERWDEYDSLSGLLLERTPGHYEAPVTRAERAFAIGTEYEQQQALSELSEAEETLLALSGISVSLATEDPGFTRQIADLWTTSDRSLGNRVGGHVMRAYSHFAQGRKREGMREMAVVETLDPVSALEHQTLLACLPFFSASRDELEQLHSRLTAWNPDNQPVTRAASDFFWHTDIHPQLRAYLLGLVNIRLDQHDAALEYANELEIMAVPPGAGSLAADLAFGLRAEHALTTGSAERALAQLQNSKMEVSWPRMHLSPFHSRGLQRYRRGAILADLGQDQEAIGWLSVERWNPYDLVFLAPSNLLIARLYDDQGDFKRATPYYTRFIELWGDADGEFQPRVTEVQTRLLEMAQLE